MLAILFGGLVLGLVGSLHCAGMCGPILVACVGACGGSAGRAGSLYHLGRLSTYALLGMAFGAAGAALQLFAGQTWLSLVAGVLLIVFGVFGRRIERHIGGSAFFARAFGWASARFGVALPGVLGLLNGLLPCGLVYTALAGAVATGQPLLGAGFMLMFGLGTLPALTAVLWGARRFGAAQRRWLPALTVVAGGFLLYRGAVATLPNDWINFLLANPQLQCH